MNLDPTIKKVVQVTEQAQLPIHVPVVLGNECFVITQQDVRRIEDSRLFSYNKLSSRGEFVTMDNVDSNVGVRDALLANTRQQTQFQQNTAINQLNMGILPELIARACNVATIQPQQQQQLLQQVAQMTVADFLKFVQPQLMPTISITPAPTTEISPATATLQQQLDWAKACNTMLTPASMHPLHHTSTTSTTEIGSSYYPPQSTATRRQCCTRACNTMDIDENISPFFHSPLTSTSPSSTGLCARQQAKQRKMAKFGN
ncbi:uncharacterized protein LOC129242812 [Anastrepha obliqua]|uniref:uncharacterized protein LOC129242812 n=1 Tax=Anastrepha obliqua TaxID=95512 RepID=UPI00240A2D9D|nr:uncharacterized protein LOC129242812 [Anastrepha obliqua]